MIELQIESLDLEANGVARADGKVVFVREALPGERVQAEIVRSKPRFDVARTLQVLRPAAARTQPRCPHFGVCGGCSMQHLDTRAQVAIKQRALEDQLAHLGNVRPEMVLRPIAGPDWGYRYRARLSVRHVTKKGGVLVGFHERGSSYVADMRDCHVLAACPGVLESAIIGKPCPVLGERVHAFVNLSDPALDAARLRAFCAERLADYKVPESFTLGTEPLPRNANGKLLKRVMREQLLAAAQAGGAA